jgi:hypothetical protein
MMIDPNYEYISSDPEYLGKIIIIDFGRTRKLTASEKNLFDQRLRKNLGGKIYLYMYPFENFYQENTTFKYGKFLAEEWYDRYHQLKDDFQKNELAPHLIESWGRTMPGLTKDNIFDKIIEYVLRTPDNYFYGGAQNVFNMKKMDMEKMDMEKMDMEKMDMEKMHMEKMDMTIEQQLKTIEKIKIHKSEFFKPIIKQLKTMTFEEFINILKKEYENDYSITNIIIKPADVSGKGGRKRKPKKNKKTQKK